MSRNINISTVSAKATLKNEGFLSRLSSTLMSRKPPPAEALNTQTSLVWHKTSEVKERIKTATGTIPVYSHMSEEEVEQLKESAAAVASLQQSSEETEMTSTFIAEAATSAFQTISETDSKSSANMFVVIDDYKATSEDGLNVTGGQKVELINDFGGSANKRLRLESEEEVQLLDNSAAKHKMAIRPKKKHPDPRSKGHDMHEERWLVKDMETGMEGLVPSRLLGAPPPGTVFATSIKRSLQDMSSEESSEVKRKVVKEIRSSKLRKSSSKVLGPSPEDEAKMKRSATIKELIETEEEFARDLEFVVRNYYSLFDDTSTPKHIRDHKEAIFGKFKFIADFHQSVLIEGVKYHADVPNLIGRTILRLERDFDKHSEYCTTEPQAHEFLEKNPEVKEYFEEFSERIGDDKQLQEHLKLPIQRLNDYQLLLKEIIKFSNRLGDETGDLERAHDLMQTIPQRATDAKFLASIEGFKGNLFKLGRLIRHDWFAVTEKSHKARDRYLFLFKARILVTKVKRITEDRSIFVLRDIIRLPETSLCGLDSPLNLEFNHIEPQNHPNYPILLKARTPEVRDAWLEIVKEHVIDTASVDDLLFDDEIRVVSEEGEEEEPGHISPTVEGEDFVEDLPEDIETNQVVPETEEKEIVIEKDHSQLIEDQIQIEEEFEFISKPTERDIPIEVEEEIKDIPIAVEVTESEVDVSTKRPLEKEEESVDFWGEKESSPPPKRRVPLPSSDSPPLIVEDVEVQETQESAHLSQEPELDDFWTQKQPSPQTTKVEPDFWSKESSELEKKEEEPYPSVPTQSSPQPEEKETESDFWSEQPSSPQEVKEVELEYLSSKEPSRQLETKEVESDFWSQQPSSPSEKKEVEADSYIPKQSSPLPDTKESEPDFLGEQPYSSQESKEVGTDFWCTKELLPQPETEEEPDFWSKQPSSPLEVKEEEIVTSSPEQPSPQLEIKEEVDFWSKQPSPSLETKETESDFWSKQPSSPPNTKEVELDLSTTNQLSQEPETKEPDFWSKQQSPLPETKEKEFDFWSEQPSIESETKKAKEKTPEPEVEQTELDFWSTRETSPPTKRPTQPAEEEPSDTWSVKDSSSEPKPSVEELTDLKQDLEAKETETEFEESVLKASESVLEETNALEVSSKRPKEEENKEEVADFWSTRESSPPLKKRATPKFEELISPVVTEVSETQENLKLEQVERSAFTAEEKVAEQIEDFTEVKEEGEVQVWDQPSKPLTEQVTDKSFKDNSEITEVEEIKSTPLRKRVRKVSSEKPEPQEAVLEEAAETKHTKSDKETTLQESKLPDSNLSTKELNVLEPEVKRTRVREPESDKSKHKASDLKEQTEEPKVKQPELKDTETPEPESKELKSTEPDIKEKEVTEVEIKEPIRRRRKPKADLIEETAASQVESSELKVEEPKEKEPEPKEKEPEVKDPVRRRRPKADLIEDTATSQVDTSELKVEEPKEKEPEPKEKEPEVKDPVRRRRRTKADIVEDTATSQSESSELKVEEPKEKEPEPKEKEPEVKDPVRRRRPKADIVEDTATSTLESSELKDTKVEEPKEQVSEVKEVEGTKSEVKEPIIRRRRTKPDQVEEATILSQSENITLNLPEVEDKTPDVTEKDNTDFKLQEPKKIESLGRRRPKPNTVDTDISQPEVISIPSPDLIDTKVKETDSELKESKIIESEVKDSLRKQSPKLDSAEEIVYSHKEPISLDPPKSEDPVLKDKKDITPEVKESEVTDIKVQKPQKKDSLRRKSKAEEVKEPEISQSESLNLQPLRKKSDPKVTTPKETETAVQKVKEPTAMDTSVPIVGLVDEDRTEFEGRHAHTSVAAAWRAPSDGSKPVFTKSLVGNVVEPGEGATFICEVEHSSQYYVSWLKDNKVLDDKLADRVQQQDDKNKHVLRLMHCHLEDSGIYTAKATDPRGSSATSSAQLLVQELTEEEREARIAEKKPFFLVKMMATEVIENTNLSYAIHVKGDPMPKVTFFKDGKPLNEDGRVKVQKNEEQGKYELVIGHVQMHDAGLYKCVAMNKYEKAECEAMMNVVEEQETLQNLQGKGSLLKPGEEADFKWFRDGVEFDPVERFNVMFKDEEDTLALVFQNVTPDDAGIYTCVASTSCGKISCSAELTVEGSIKRLTKDPAPPRFVDHLADCFVAMAGTAMLECRISGYPQPELTWLHNGVEVKVGGRVKQLWEDDENVTLIIKNISDTDKGTYTVRASNELGDASSSANLVLRTVPKFRKIDKMVTCNVGDPLHFSVEVDGEPLPELKWMKDGKEIEPSDHIKFDTCTDGTFSMRIDKMKPDDCGTYCIVATNDMGQRTEQFEIAADTPPDITRGLDPETEKKYNNDHTFEVRAHGSPIPEATWYKDGRDLSSDDKYQISRDGKFYMLKIKNLSRHDKGIYKIVLKNRNGSAESEGELLIRTPPEFTTSLSDVYAKEGSKQIKLFVEWVSNPRSTTKWTYKDKEISDSTPGYTIKNTDTTSTLIIDVADLKSAGSYSITVSNEYGDRTTGCRFRLHEPPQVHEPLKDVEYLEDTQCKFQCKVTGVPIPEVKWEKDGQKWTPDESRVCLKKEGEEYYYILFEAAKTEDTAHYRANFSNVEGSIFTEGNILVNTPPHITRSNFRDGLTFIAMHKFVLEVEAWAVPEAEATWYLDGRELKEEEDSVKFSFDGKVYRMERIGSDPENTGEYKCTLKNKIATVDEAAVITIIEKEARVRKPLKTINVKEKTDGTIQCQIVGDPIPTVEWFRDGVQVGSSGRLEIKTDTEKRMHFLTFKNLEEEDKCTFTLKGINEHGECETSCVMNVYIVPRPGDLQDTVVDFGRDLLLSVKIHSIPHPDITWFKNGTKLDESDRVLYLRDDDNEVYSLEIKSTVVEDGATYSFKAVNEVGEASRECLVKIHTEKPTIATPLKNMEICLEDEVTFSIKCAALPAPEVEWTNKGKAITDDDRYSLRQKDNEYYRLTLRDVQAEDYGAIKFIAKNLAGEISSTAQLIQKKLPCEIIEGLENVTKGAEGEEVTLSVVIKGSPRPKFVWTKDGDEVEASANIKLGFEKKSYCEATISLTIMNAAAADSGQYRMRFFNEVNEEQTETALVVRPERKHPKISAMPKDLKVNEMEPGCFRCKISGYPKPDVKWLKDGRPVRPTDILNMGMTADGEYFLEFKNITLEDAGKYTLVATNEEGSTECDVLLNVNPSPSKPKFTTGLTPTKVIAGYPCRMEVQLDGFPKPQIAWLKDGEPVEIDGNLVKEIITDDGRVILQIDNASEGDAGEYTVVATNDMGETTSSASLGVLDHERKDGQPDGKPVFSEGLKDSCFDEGKTIKLPVCVKGGPVPDMKWYKGGKEIKLSDRCFYTYDGDKTYLEIHPCAGADSGKYKCVIQNPHGKEETQCEVTVRKCYESPAFTYTYPNQEQLPGKDAKFVIKVDGVPKPEISWFFKGKPIVPDGDKYRVRKDPDGCTLFVRNTTYSDTGAYKVIARNLEGKIEHEAKLLVADQVDPTRKSEAPAILKAIGDQELYEGYTAKFKAVVAGRPQPEFEWYRNGVKLFHSKRFISEMDEDGLIRLTIKYVCEEDAGVYELRVWNEHGKASCKGKLICECISKHKKRPVGDEYQGFDKIRTAGVPVPLPERPIISALSDRRCTLSWIPFMPAGPMPPVTYQVEMCEMPEGDWMTTSSGIRGCSVDILNLCPKSDYRFRVRVENKFGVSEPSPYVSTFRSRLEREPLSYLPHLDPMDDCIFEGPFVPSGFKIDRDPLGNFFAPPRFLRLDHDTQYGMKNFSGHVKWIGYGYPTPKLKFFYKEKEIRFGNGSRYSFTQEAEGEIFLFIDNLTEDDVGWYNCVAHNEYGESHQRIRLGLSEYPRVLQHLRETYIKGEGSGRIFCRISTYPQCDVTWYKDWHEIKPSMKLRPQFIEPDMYCLNFTGVSVTDTGLYSVAAVNVAGAVSSSCMVNVEDNEAVYNWYGFGRGFNVGINMRRGTLEDHYDIGDELGRGTQGIIYHCSERHSGRNFAAKSMWGKDQFKQWMHNEFEMMNYINSCPRVIRLHDAYESHKNMVLVTELCSGGELLHHLTEGQFYTEYEVAHYIKQVLEGLEYMHERFIAHLGLNIGDIMLTRPNGTDIKFGDLSLARNIRLKTLYALEYGMPEFVAPEVVKGEHVAYPADMWSVGIITYLLLSGTSPFKGEHDKETLTRIKKGELRFDVDAFSNLSAEAKDFIAKLLQFKQEHRLDVKSALVHPWIKFSEMTPHDPYKISTERLRKYYSSFKDWYGNASCRRWYRRRTLASAFTHPSKMVYPPGEAYTPPESPERALVPAKPLEDYRIPDHDLSYEVGDFKSDSNYQQGPDTYLLQLRDTEFPVRLRSYMNINRERSPIAMFTGRDVSYDYDRVPIVHERRRFTDIMDEEIKDERRRTMMDKYTAGFIRSKQTTCSLELPARVKNEVPAHLAIRDEPEFIKKGAEGKGTPPFIREKPSTTSVTPDMDITFTCVVSAEPEPIIQWFRNDTILGDTDRIKIKTTGGRSTLSITGCNDHDLGSYKILVRNWGGQAVHKFRLVRAEIPCMCEPPEVQEVSGTQVLLKWMSPLEDGGAQIEQYHLQFKLADKDEWSTVNDSITQEAYLVEGLSPNKPYQFRVAAKNIRGWGDFSVATPSIRTGIQDVADIKMPIEQKLAQNQKLQVLQLPGSRGEIRDQVDYSREIQPVPLKTGEGATLQMQKYQMIYEIARGRFSSIMRCLRPDDQRTFSCKINLRKDRGDAIKNEYEVAKSLRHERLATMYEAYELPEVTSFIIEYLGGPDVLTFLSDKLQYTEQHVSTVINQVLDGLSYLHWRGLCHLDIQPDNVVVTSHHKLDVKLVDFGNTQRVPSAGATVHVNGLLDYIAPEVLFDSTAFPTSDIWSLGVLTYVLLTGESPFEGPEEEQTLENIQCVRAVFETLGEHASQEATRFILLIFKRDPSKRPTEEECREHRWLAENDFMVKKRERTVLSITRLREYTKAYHKMRQRQASNSNIFSSFINKC